MTTSEKLSASGIAAVVFAAFIGGIFGLYNGGCVRHTEPSERSAQSEKKAPVNTEDRTGRPNVKNWPSPSGLDDETLFAPIGEMCAQAKRCRKDGNMVEAEKNVAQAILYTDAIKAVGPNKVKAYCQVAEYYAPCDSEQCRSFYTKAGDVAKSAVGADKVLAFCAVARSKKRSSGINEAAHFLRLAQEAYKELRANDQVLVSGELRSTEKSLS